jgi:hypothetical protein
MNVNLITSELTVTVNGINDIYYLKTIPVYINTIVRITQDITSSGIPSSKIKTLCSGKEVEDIEFGHITAQSEQTLDDNAVPNIKDEGLLLIEDTWHSYVNKKYYNPSKYSFINFCKSS